MTFLELLRGRHAVLPMIAMHPEGEGAGGEGDGNDPPPPGGEGEGGDTRPPPGGEQIPKPKWFEGDAITAETREWMTKRGLATDDPTEAAIKAVTSYQNAERRFGKDPNTLMEAPGKDQSVAEFMRANAKVFDVPEAADGYELDLEMPEGMEYDSGLADKVRAVAHEHGLPKGAAKALAETYRDHVAEVVKGLNTDIEQDKAALMAGLEKDWGDQTSAKIAMARQAVSAIGEKAGLDANAIQAMGALLKKDVGDPGIIRMFAAVGELMGEDSLEGFGSGASGLGMTPAEARQQLQEMDAPTGEFAKAMAANDRATLKRLKPQRDQLLRLASGR